MEDKTMKKLLFSFMILAGILCSCDPVCDDIQPGGVVDESALQLDVHATTTGGNQIILTNNTKGVGSYWDYGIGRSSAQCDTILIPYLGEQTITFTGLCDGGTVTTTRKITVSKIDHPTAQEWAFFAGTGSDGKTWTWDDAAADAVYGTGGYMAEFVPNWTTVALADTEEPEGYMVFDLNGGPNFTLYKGDGTVAAKGKFAFDMSSRIDNTDDGSQWSIGTLTLTGATVLNGHLCGYTDPVYKYSILTLTDDKLVLCAAADGAIGWDEGTIWLFKKK
jgi:hypothetical protein